jgi:Glyoxalase/Bleomycin resistance protein/Dioxygenase superfamily
MPCGQITLDHLAIGVERWADAYPRFVADLGGQWAQGGDAGGYAPCQLTYRDSMRIELIAPSSSGGFMRRFLGRNGPGAHHLTFKVPALGTTLAELAGLGIEPLGGRTDMPFWREAFLHPKLCGVGTLLQVIQIDEGFPAPRSPAPDGFPAALNSPLRLSWVGLTAGFLPDARSLLADVLGGTVVNGGDHWMLVSWGAGRSLLVRDGNAAPGGRRLWDGSPSPGVSHVMFGPPDLGQRQIAEGVAGASRLPHDELTRIPVWVAPDTAATG